MTLCTRLSVGGAQLNSFLVASELKKRGHEVSSCFLFEGGVLPQEESFSSHTFIKSRQSVFALLKVFYRYTVFCRDFKPDVVVGFHPLANILAALLCRFLGYKFVATQRNPSSSMQASTKLLDKFLGSFIYDENICVSHSVKQSFSSYPKSYRDGLSVIYNGLENIAKDVIRKTPVIPLRVGFLGRLDQQKNPGVIVELALQAKKKAPGIFKFLLAGDGPMRKDLEYSVSSNNLSNDVIFLGQINSDQLHAFFSDIDIFLMPSKFEGFGRSLLENMMFGNPMVLSDIDVFREIAADCAYYSDGSVDSYLNGLLHAKQILSRSDFEVFRDNIVYRSSLYSVEAMIDSYESVISK